MSAALTVSLDDATLARLEQAASQRRMTHEAVVKAALDDFLDANEDVDDGPLLPWQLDLVRQGIAAADRGDFASQEEVAAFFRQHGS